MTDCVVQPIARALQVLCALNERSFATLHDLHASTGLPKPTIHRILATLQSEGYVARDAQRGIYRPKAKVQHLSAGFSEAFELVEIGADILREATKEVRWLLALGTLDGAEVVVRYSTMPFSNFTVGSTYRRQTP
jgi:IclR family mhp operon transcriptional activator